MSKSNITKKAKPIPPAVANKYKPYPKSKLCDPTKPYSGTEIWGTLDGQVIPIVNLREEHLKRIRGHLVETNRLYFLKYIDAEIERRKKLKLTKKSKAGRLLYGHKKTTT